jgi:hypothetical protein
MKKVALLKVTEESFVGWSTTQSKESLSMKVKMEMVDMLKKVASMSNGYQIRIILGPFNWGF